MSHSPPLPLPTPHEGHVIRRRRGPDLARRRTFRGLGVALAATVLASAGSELPDGGPGALIPGFPSGTGPNGTVLALLETAEGGILVGGAFDRFNDLPAAAVVRLRADGTLDEEFTSRARDNGPSSPVEELAVGPEGRIYLTRQGNPGRFVVRHLPDGSRDTTYSPPLLYPSGSLLPDGSVVTVTTGAFEGLLRRLDALGNSLPGFEHRLVTDYLGRRSPGSASVTRFDSEGRLLVWGSFNLMDGVPRGLVRLLADGSVDPAVDVTFISGANVLTLWPLSDSTLVFARWPSWPSPRLHLLRKTASGANDPLGTTVPQLDAPNAPPLPTETGLLLRDVGLQTDGKLVLGGSFQSIHGQTCPGIARLRRDGALDTTFSAGSGFQMSPPDTYSGDLVTRVLVRANGSVLVGGAFRSVQGVPHPHLALLQGDRPIEPPRIADIRLESGRLTFTLAARAGHRYQMETNADLAKAVWMRAGAPIVAEASTLRLSIDVPAADAHRCFLGSAPSDPTPRTAPRDDLINLQVYYNATPPWSS